MKPLGAAPAWRTAAEIALWRHGWAWPLATLLIAASVAVYFAALLPSRLALASLSLELAQKQQAIGARTAAAQAPAVQNEPQRLQALQAVLRRSPDAGELVRTMVGLARTEQIQLAQSDYQRQFHGATQVSQVQVTQPVRATYPQLRRYIESVLRSVPNASLDQVTAKRDSVGQAQVEARLKWSLWIQSPQPSDAKLLKEATP